MTDLTLAGADDYSGIHGDIVALMTASNWELEERRITQGGDAESMA